MRGVAARGQQRRAQLQEEAEQRSKDQEARGREGVILGSDSSSISDSGAGAQRRRSSSVKAVKAVKAVRPWRSVEVSFASAAGQSVTIQVTHVSLPFARSRMHGVGALLSCMCLQRCGSWPWHVGG